MNLTRSVPEDKNRGFDFKGATGKFVSSPDEVSKMNLVKSIHKDKNHVFAFNGATERSVSSSNKGIEEKTFKRIIRKVNRNKFVSRLHSKFLNNAEQENSTNQNNLSKKLLSVDLACSGKVAKEIIFDEAKNTNNSLAAVRNVMPALTDSSKINIPYQELKLTNILQEFLGRNGRTTINMCYFPTAFNEFATKFTLDYGKQEKTIKSVYAKEQANLIGTTDLVASTICENDNGPMFDILGGGLMARFDEERRKFEEERLNLYHQLNEKDKEINQQSQSVEKLKKQLKEREELIACVRSDYEQLQQKVSTINQEPKSDNEDVLQVLVKLAVNYDQKLQEIKIKNKENKALKEEVLAKQTALDSVTSELQQLKLHKRSAEMLNVKMKSEVERLMQRCQDLETFQADYDKKICEHKRNLANCQRLVSQHEARILTLTKSMEEAEARKCALEENVNSLREECAKLKAAEQAQVMKNKENAEKEEAATKSRITLQKQINQLRDDFHQKQVATLKDEISKKQEMINELNNQNQKLTVAHNQIQANYNQLKQKAAKKSHSGYNFDQLTKINQQVSVGRDLQRSQSGVEENMRIMMERNIQQNSFVDERQRSQNMGLMYNSYTQTVWHKKYQY